jgi:hypothetical protein
MAKRVSTQRIRKHRHYTYEDAAELLGVSVQTVRSWKGQGLEVLDEGRPHYILGEALIEFLADRQRKTRSVLAPDQVYCFSCRAPKRPLGLMVDYVPINASRGRLVALCETCEGTCQKFASKAGLKALGGILDIGTGNGSQA